jgi:hypothetical protein
MLTYDGRGSRWVEARVDRLNDRDLGYPPKKWTRAVRAVALLERIATPDAVSLLKAMSTGHPDAQPTTAAEALTRIEGNVKTTVPGPTIPHEPE